MESLNDKIRAVMHRSSQDGWTNICEDTKFRLSYIMKVYDTHVKNIS